MSAYKLDKCTVCKKQVLCCQHHTKRGSGRKTSPTVPICDHCHARVHNPTSFGLEANWAYSNGFLTRHNNEVKKAYRKKLCQHSKTYFDSRQGSVKCQYCGKILD